VRRCVCVCVCVCPSVDTLTVAFLRRFSRNWTQTSKPPKVRTSSLGSISPSLHYFPPKNPQFWGVNKRFKAKLAKSKNVHIIETTASFPIKFCTVIKTIKCPSCVVPTHALQIQDGGRTAAIFKKSQNCYISAAVRAIVTKFGTHMQFDPLNSFDR